MRLCAPYAGAPPDTLAAVVLLVAPAPAAAAAATAVLPTGTSTATARPSTALVVRTFDGAIVAEVAGVAVTSARRKTFPFPRARCRCTTRALTRHTGATRGDHEVAIRSLGAARADVRCLAYTLGPGQRILTRTLAATNDTISIPRACVLACIALEACGARTLPST